MTSNKTAPVVTSSTGPLHATSTKDRIAEVAARLFAEKSVGATSIREICRAAGITAPSLYHHFQSKNGLLRAIVFETLESFIGDVAELDEHRDLDDALARLATRAFDFGDARPESVRLIAQLDNMPLPADIRARTTELQTKSLHGIAGIFRRAVSRQELPEVDPEYCAMSFVGLIMFHLAARASIPTAQRPPVDDVVRKLVCFTTAGATGLGNA